MCGCVEQVAVDAHVNSEGSLKAEVPRREPQPGSARSLEQDESMSTPIQEGHAKDIETGWADPASSASSAGEQGADPVQRGRVAVLCCWYLPAAVTGATHVCSMSVPSDTRVLLVSTPSVSRSIGSCSWLGSMPKH